MGAFKGLGDSLKAVSPVKCEHWTLGILCSLHLGVCSKGCLGALDGLSWLGRRQQVAPLMWNFCFASEQESAWEGKPSACVCFPRGVHGVLQWDCAGRDIALPVLVPLSPDTSQGTS